MTHDIDTRDAIIADLSVRLAKAEARIEELNELVDHVEEESGLRDCLALEAEIARLRGVLILQECDTAYWKERAERLARQCGNGVPS